MEHVKLVALETTGKQGSIASAETMPDGARIVQHDLPLDSRSAQSLAPALAGLLAEHRWHTRELGAVAVAAGPGSFTGLRVGITTAKMLAYAAGCGVVELNTLAVIAAQVPEPAAAVWAVIDAHRGELFAARFPTPNSKPTTQLLKREEWLALLSPGDTVAGPVLDSLLSSLPPGVSAADRAVWSPQAKTIAQLALPLAQQGALINPAESAPRYHRLSAAEEKAMRRPPGP